VTVVMIGFPSVKLQNQPVGPPGAVMQARIVQSFVFTRTVAVVAATVASE
jgi:hypothetical protein